MTPTSAEFERLADELEGSFTLLNTGRRFAYIAALRQAAAMAKDAERWRAGVKFCEFPEFCSHDSTQASGVCWYMPINGKPFQTAEEAIDTAMQKETGHD
jgi:hypothetical protein